MAAQPQSPLDEPITAEVLAARWGKTVESVRALARNCKPRPQEPYTLEEVEQIWEKLLLKIAQRAAWRSYRRGGLPPALEGGEGRTPYERVEELVQIARIGILKAQRGEYKDKPEREILKAAPKTARRALIDAYRPERKRANREPSYGDDPFPDQYDPNAGGASGDDPGSAGIARLIKRARAKHPQAADVHCLITFGKHHLSAVRAAQDMGYTAVATAFELGALTAGEAFGTENPKKRDSVRKRVEVLRRTGAAKSKPFPKSAYADDGTLSDADARKLGRLLKGAYGVHPKASAIRTVRPSAEIYGPNPSFTWEQVKSRRPLASELRPAESFKRFQLRSAIEAGMARQQRREYTEVPEILWADAQSPTALLLEALRELEAEQHADYLFWQLHAKPGGVAVIESCMVKRRGLVAFEMPTVDLWKVAPNIPEDHSWLWRKNRQKRRGFQATSAEGKKTIQRQRAKIVKLQALAERPGTGAEGEAARRYLEIARARLPRLLTPSANKDDLKGRAHTENARDMRRIQWQAEQRRKWEQDLKAKAGIPDGARVITGAAMVREFNRRQKEMAQRMTVEALLAAS